MTKNKRLFQNPALRFLCAFASLREIRRISRKDAKRKEDMRCAASPSLSSASFAFASIH
jgi:hypothetical protein